MNLGLYIHTPWCLQKCPYCDFNSHPLQGELPERAYIDALLRDLELELPLVWGRRCRSIFIGGGTPSLFSAESIDRLLSSVRALIPLTGDCEVTLEANPGAIEVGRFAELRGAGINRLSIGVQSFHDSQLQALGRIHSGTESKVAIEAAHQADFERLNLDLMFGLPGQQPTEALADIETAIALSPSHISYYQLTIEPNTPYARNPPLGLPDEEQLWRIEQQGLERLQQGGFQQYEVSAHARGGDRCRHNLNYWHFGDYLGIGAGAHGKITQQGTGTIERRWRIPQPQRYLQLAGSPQVCNRQTLQRPSEIAFEFMINALRLYDGFEMALFGERTALPLEVIAEPLERAEALGLLLIDGGRITPSERGRRYLNELLTLFIEDPKSVAGDPQG